MSHRVYRVTLAEAICLISSHEGFKVKPDEVEIFSRYARASTSLWVGVVDNDIVAVWGLIPPTLLAEQAYIWLHTTEELSGHEFTFIRQSQIMMREMLRRFPGILGHCMVDSPQSQRWLRLLGAKFFKPEGLLVPFEIRAA